MGNWRYGPSRRYNHNQHQQRTSGYGYPPRDCDCGVPEWEKKFCYVIGRIPWCKVIEASTYMRKGVVMKWNDSAAEEAFKNAKQRFWAKTQNSPCDIPLPDRDMYIDEINWEPVIDLELMEGMEKDRLYFSEDESRDEWHQKNQTKNSPVDANPCENSQPKLCAIGLWLENLRKLGNYRDNYGWGDDNGWGDSSKPEELEKIDSGWDDSWPTKQDDEALKSNKGCGTKDEMDTGWRNYSWKTKQESSRGWGNSRNQNNAPQSVGVRDKRWENSLNQNSAPQSVGAGDNRWGGKKWGNHGPVQRYCDNSGRWNGRYQKMYAFGNSSSKFQPEDNKASCDWKNHRGNKGHGFTPRRR